MRLIPVLNLASQDYNIIGIGRLATVLHFAQDSGALDSGLAFHRLDQLQDFLLLDL